MTAVLDKLKGDKLNTLLHAGNILSVLRKDVDTNLTDDEITSLGAYISGFTTKDLHFDKIPYTGDVELADGDDLIPDQSALARVVQNNLVAPPTPEPSIDPMTLAGIAPNSIRVDVQNASGVNGAARLVAAALRKAGFLIGDVGNAEISNLDKTKIEEHSSVTFAGAKVRAALPAQMRDAQISGAPAATTSPDPTATAQPSDVTVIIGADLAAAIVAKTSSSPQPNR